jgi:hypothetical protein
VTDRTRTGDIQNHNLGLYQLSYDHRWKENPTDLFKAGQFSIFKGTPVPNSPVHNSAWTLARALTMMGG